MLKDHIVRAIPKVETEEILGFVYFETARVVLNWEKQLFINRFEAYLLAGLAKPEEKRFFDLLIELASLTFSLYKWGMLLYSTDEKMDDNRIYTIRYRGKLCIVSDPALFDVTGTLKPGEVGLALIDAETKQVVFTPESGEKSQLLLILLELYRQADVESFMVKLEKYDEHFSGSYVGFDAKHAYEQRDFLRYIGGEFESYKGRLDELQALFYNTFRVEQA